LARRNPVAGCRLTQMSSHEPAPGRLVPGGIWKADPRPMNSAGTRPCLGWLSDSGGEFQSRGFSAAGCWFRSPEPPAPGRPSGPGPQGASGVLTKPLLMPCGSAALRIDKQRIRRRYGPGGARWSWPALMAGLRLYSAWSLISAEAARRATPVLP